MPLPATLRPLALALAAALSGGLLTACGHPASATECDELFAKSAEIELRAQRITDLTTIKEKTEAARTAEPGVAFTTRCVGRRITERALACARRATTAEQLDRCL